MTTEQKIKEVLKERLILKHDVLSGSVIHSSSIDELTKEISSLIPKWRKVEEGNPEEATAILIFFKYWNTFVKGSYCKDIKGNDLWISEEARTIYEPVEYWMYESEILDLIPKP